MKVNVLDTSLRDGMHSVSHQFTPEHVAGVAAGLDAAGVRWIEVTHGDGLMGDSIQYGHAAASDEQLVAAAAGAVEQATIAALLLPGIGTVEGARRLQAAGVGALRVATHCTEADIAQQHITWARENGLFVTGFLMLSHMLDPGRLAEQARLMESYGAHAVYVVDSAGALLPDGVRARTAALREALECEVGFHAHNNLGCAIGNSLAALENGVGWLDGSLRGLGAGAGNAATEVLCAALDRAGHETGVDLWKVMDVAEEVVAPIMPRPQVIDRTALVLGYAGVYSSFLLHAERAGRKYGVGTREILVELGRRGVVGGQEDIIIEVAAELARMDAPVGAGEV
jgi:4-hydroxy 2-oxovalerate aldolase